MITTIAQAADLRIAPNQFWEFVTPQERNLDVLDPYTGNTMFTAAVDQDAALRIDGHLDDDEFQVRAEQHGETYVGILMADDTTEVRLVGN